MLNLDQTNRSYTLDYKIANKYRIKDASINFMALKKWYDFVKYTPFFCVKKWKWQKYYYVPSCNNLSLIPKSFDRSSLNIDLKEHQSSVLSFCHDVLKIGRSGLVISWEWTGKTIMMLQLALTSQHKTIIVVPSVAISEWFKKTRERFWPTNRKISFVTAWSYNYAVDNDIVVMTHVSFNMLYDIVNKNYWMLIIDECDLLPKTRIEQLIMRAGNYFGFTATPKRKEFWIEWFQMLFGPSINTNIQSLPVTVYKYLYEHDYTYDDFVKYCSDIASDSPEVYRRLTCNNSDRTSKLHDIIQKTKHTKYIIFSDRSQHIQDIITFLQSKWYHNIFQLDWSTNKKKFFESIAGLDNYIIVANTRSGWRWFDLPSIECWILFTSTSWENTVRQSSWRSRREDWNKTIWYYVDFVDKYTIEWSKPKYLWRYERKKVYTTMWRPIIDLQLNSIFDD